MERLIYCYSESDGYTYSYEIAIPFEYSSKEDFVLDTLEKWESETSDKAYKRLRTLGRNLQEVDIKSLESDIYTLEEWFLINKEVI